MWWKCYPKLRFVSLKRLSFCDAREGPKHLVQDEKRQKKCVKNETQKKIGNVKMWQKILCEKSQKNLAMRLQKKFCRQKKFSFSAGGRLRGVVGSVNTTYI